MEQLSPGFPLHRADAGADAATCFSRPSSLSSAPEGAGTAGPTVGSGQERLPAVASPTVCPAPSRAAPAWTRPLRVGRQAVPWPTRRRVDGSRLLTLVRGSRNHPWNQGASFWVTLRRRSRFLVEMAWEQPSPRSSVLKCLIRVEQRPGKKVSCHISGLRFVVELLAPYEHSRGGPAAQ